MGKTPEQTISDNDLWSELKQGKEASFGMLFKKYYSNLYFYGIKLLNDPELVKESIQEIFVRIWETRERLSPDVQVKPYLLVSLRRMVLLRKAEIEKGYLQKLPVEENLLFSFEESDFVAHGHVPDKVRHCVLEAIEELTARQRELIMLFFYQGLSYDEIASVINISVPAVRNLMYRSLIRLRKRIGEETIESIKNLLFLMFAQKKI